MICWHCVDKSDGIGDVNEKFLDGKDDNLRWMNLDFDEFVLGLNDLERNGHLLAFRCSDYELKRYERVLGDFFGGSLGLWFLN